MVICMALMNLEKNVIFAVMPNWPPWYSLAAELGRGPIRNVCHGLSLELTSELERD